MSQQERRTYGRHGLEAVEYLGDDGRVVVRYDLTGGTITNWSVEDGDGQPESSALSPEAAAHLAQLSTLEERLARVEAHLWPPAGDNDPGRSWTDVAVAGAVPAGAVVRDADGVAYRNVSGGWLNVPPSGLPGAPSDWRQLWARAGAGGAAGGPTRAAGGGAQ